jgi:hypothetical protein
MDTFQGLNHTTMDRWIDWSGAKPQWTLKALEHICKGNEPGWRGQGERGILVSISVNLYCTFTKIINLQANYPDVVTFTKIINLQANYPDVVTSVKEQLQILREHGAQISVITARGMLLATIMLSAPEILEKKFKDGSTFLASDSFVHKWLHDTLKWTPCQGTQAANKHPLDWEDQCERSFLCKAYVIKEEDIPLALWVNSDQTQVVYAPGDKMTWAEKGSKQVAVHGAEEKCAFTVIVSVASNGIALPLQAIYGGKTARSTPSSKSPDYNMLINAGFLLEESGMTMYWSNHEKMHSFVNKILAPYFARVKGELGLPASQKSMWSIDVWSVH